MGVVEISDGVSTRRIRVEDLQGVVRVDCSGGSPTVLVPEDAEVDCASVPDTVGDPGTRGRISR